MWKGPLSIFPRTLKHIRLQLHADCSKVFMFFSRPFAAVIAQDLHVLPDLRLISIEKEFTAKEYYLELRKACETHKIEILVSSSDLSGILVVSAYQRSQLQLSVTSIRDAGVRFGLGSEPEPHRTAPGVQSGSGSRCKILRKFRWGPVRGAPYAMHPCAPGPNCTAPRTLILEPYPSLHTSMKMISFFSVLKTILRVYTVLYSWHP
jgi:hypothetical protein